LKKILGDKNTDLNPLNFISGLNDGNIVIFIGGRLFIGHELLSIYW